MVPGISEKHYPRKWQILALLLESILFDREIHLAVKHWEEFSEKSH